VENFPSEISPEQLLHHKLQAIIRDNVIPEEDLMYLGERNGMPWYRVGPYELPITDIEGIEPKDEDDSRV
jgi:hypothetical protein